jgi:hypothetical protein
MLTPRSNRILKSPELALSPVADPSHHAVLDRPRRIDWRFENHAAARSSGLTEPIVERQAARAGTTIFDPPGLFNH